MKSKKCNGCPFNDGWNEEATKLQDLGCLPSKFDITETKDKEGVNWQCHSAKRVCGGLAEVRDVSKGEIVSFDYFFPPIDLMAKANELPAAAEAE